MGTEWAQSCLRVASEWAQSWHEVGAKPLRPVRHDAEMVQSAPRYDRRLLRAIRRLDDESVPIAEVCRRVGAQAEKLGVPRPSYVHVRRIVLSERERAAELREIRNEALAGLVTRMAPDPVDLLLRRQEALAGDRLRPGRPTPRR